MKKRGLMLKPVAICVMAILSGKASAMLHFEPSMITGEYSVASLAAFEQGAALSPGRYPVELYVDGNRIGRRTLAFSLATSSYAHDPSGLHPCLTGDDLANSGIKMTAFPALMQVKPGTCLPLEKIIPGAFTRFDTDNMRLNISIPQAALIHRPKGWVPPARWDEGINAVLLDWQLSGSQSRGEYGNSHSEYLYLTSGLNLGAWRLRDNSTWSSDGNAYQSQRQWRHINTWAERDIIPWRSELLLGDGTTSDTVFDAFSYRGVQLATSDSMYPESVRSYAPVIRGVANSNARVSVLQNGNVIYQTFVAPGAFVIDDLNTVSSAGDLTVQVREADGTLRVFTVPYSSIPVLQRQGHLRYALTAGHYRSAGEDTADPPFLQGVVQWGLPHDVTVYGGLLQAVRYHSAALGAGINLGIWGALSADVTQADSVLPDNSRHQGQSVRFLYARSLLTTGTTFQLAGYRYSTQGFHTLSETAERAMSGWNNTDVEVDAAGRQLAPDWHNYYSLYNSRRQQVTVNLSQSLGSFGSAYVSGSHQTYWQSDATTDDVQIGLSSTFHSVSWSLSWGYSRVSGQPDADRTLYLGLSMPLGNPASNPVYVTTSLNRDSNGNSTLQTGVSGSADNNQLSWSVAQGYDRRDGGSGDTSLDYSGSYGSLSAGYGYSRHYRQLRYGASGGVVVHRGGATFGQQPGDTSVLVDAAGAADVSVADMQGIHTDSRGYALVPYASQYQQNEVALDVSTLNNHTDIDNPVVSVVPTQGAIVRARFRVHSGAHALLTLLHNGQPLPFGTAVTSGSDGGLVGDGGQVYLTGLSSQDSLQAKWGTGAGQQCRARFSLPADANKLPLVQQQVNCQ
ncbi:outer membrane usher protein [Izhakiella capsodis]|uniref:Outer membrane usher protein n=1 Tax=Izhakiella capsodis TaxID=1367852 RepID=A0A1I4VZK9_9GAMM|nr:fimbria/pilus outer membrane usher protein [Izhakiella capsodis]SFN06744.1 outer membrane usher protein [Izhakiella capsodis]